MRSTVSTASGRTACFAACAGLLALALPAPARGGQAGKGPLKVFILAGQSNMEGQGAVKANPNRNGGKGSLEYMTKDEATADLVKHTIDANGKWVVRDDVWIWYLGRKGGLTVGYGARGDRIGPEFQFGHAMGDAFENQVLLIKTAWGGKSIQKDFRPPSSGGQVGPFYRQMIGHIKDVLANIKLHFPAYDGRGYEIAGFGWHQGWNDGCSMPASQEYEKNLANFIRDVRKELGVPNMPFVIANSGFGGRNNKNTRRLMIMNAQAAVATHDDLKGNVVCVETRDFFRPPDVSPSRQGYHWNGNAETYFLIGKAMGEAMAELAGGAAGGAGGGGPRTFLCGSYGRGKVYRVSADGKIEWEYPARNVQDVWGLADGSILFSHRFGATIVNEDKKVLWSFRTAPEVHSCQPLPNGNVLVSLSGQSMIAEVDGKGKIARKIRFKSARHGDRHMQLRHSRLTSDGTYLVVLSREQKVIEVDGDGKILRTISAPEGVSFDHVSTATRLRNGNTLIGTGYGKCAVEIDRDGKVAWRVTGKDLRDITLDYVAAAERLANGNTVLTCYKGTYHLLEVTPDKEVVWKMKVSGTGGISASHLLDQKGDAAKGDFRK